MCHVAELVSRQSGREISCHWQYERKEACSQFSEWTYKVLRTRSLSPHSGIRKDDSAMQWKRQLILYPFHFHSKPCAQSDFTKRDSVQGKSKTTSCLPNNASHNQKIFSKAFECPEDSLDPIWMQNISCCTGSTFFWSLGFLAVNFRIAAGSVFGRDDLTRN